jgi:hypothetical protein
LLNASRAGGTCRGVEAQEQAQEIREQSDARLAAQQVQVDDLRQQLSTREVESARFDSTVQELTKHIAALEQGARAPRFIR